MTKIDNIHAGHRDRLRCRYIRNGIKSFEEHQVLELLLTYSITRKDTNELAHNLINRFGSLVNVLNADVSVLRQVEGIGDRTAVFLSLIGDIRSEYMNVNATPKNMQFARDVIDHCKKLFKNKTCEELYMICLDKNMFHLNTVQVSGGEVDFAIVSRREIISLALNNKAHSVIIAHNHPRTNAIPSFTDDEFTRKLLIQMYNCGVNVLEHIIIGINNTFYSYKQSGKLDSFKQEYKIQYIR